MFNLFNPFQAIMDESRIQRESFCWLEETETGVEVYYSTPSNLGPNLLGELQGRGWVQKEPDRCDRRPDGVQERVWVEPKLTTRRLVKVPFGALPKILPSQKDIPPPVYQVELTVHGSKVSIRVNGCEVAYLRETGVGPRLGLDTGTGGDMLRLGLGLDQGQFLLII